MHATEGKEEEEMRLLSAQQNLHTTVGLEKRHVLEKSSDESLQHRRYQAGGSSK